MHGVHSFLLEKLEFGIWNRKDRFLSQHASHVVTRRGPISAETRQTRRCIAAKFVVVYVFSTHNMCVCVCVCKS